VTTAAQGAAIARGEAVIPQGREMHRRGRPSKDSHSPGLSGPSEALRQIDTHKMGAADLV
jgi:hypothetical protein